MKCNKCEFGRSNVKTMFKIRALNICYVIRYFKIVRKQKSLESVYLKTKQMLKHIKPILKKKYKVQEAVLTF